MRRPYFLLLIFLPMFTPAVPEAASRDFSEAGKSAPVFELPDTAGAKVSLEQFKGKVVLLSFWATWCNSCKAEMPSLNRLHAEFGPQGFTVLAVAMDSPERLVKKVIAEKAVTFPVLMDNDKEVSFDQYAVMALPVAFLIDRNGVIVEKLIGEREWDAPDMKERVMKLLKRR